MVVLSSSWEPVPALALVSTEQRTLVTECETLLPGQQCQNCLADVQEASLKGAGDIKTVSHLALLAEDPTSE